MNSLLSAGIVFGGLAGLAHALAVYLGHFRGSPARRTAPGAVRARAAYYALWTLLLWILFGTYVLVLWLVALVAHSAHALLARIRSTNAAATDR